MELLRQKVANVKCPIHILENFKEKAIWRRVIRQKVGQWQGRDSLYSSQVHGSETKQTRTRHNSTWSSGGCPTYPRVQRCQVTGAAAGQISGVLSNAALRQSRLSAQDGPFQKKLRPLSLTALIIFTFKLKTNTWETF